MNKSVIRQPATHLVSVVITTKNEEKNIASCIRSIKKQDYPGNNVEIIVVDNHSTDQTKQIAKKFTRNVYTGGPERSAQRNFGARKSHGLYFLYLDADMELSPTVISECVTQFQKNSDLIGLYIPEIVTGDSFWAHVRRFERSFYDATVIDCVRMVKLKSFVDVSGFDESMSGPEDWDFDKKIRSLGVVDIIKAPIFHNEAKFDLKKYLEKKGYYSKSFPTYIKKWEKDDPDVTKQLSFFYRYIGVFIEKGKWTKLVLHPVLTVGMYYLRARVGLKYLLR